MTSVSLVSVDWLGEWGVEGRELLTQVGLGGIWNSCIHVVGLLNK